MENIVKKIQKKTWTLRKLILGMCVKAKTGHVTSSMSCVEILASLYYGNIMRHDPLNPQWPDRDRFILSKGQASPALYAVLADCGYFSNTDLKKFAQKGGKFGVHLQNSVPGVEITCGSLGQGFGFAAGLALAAKMDQRLHLVFTLLGDGECYEGSIWETAMFAAHNRLNNLVAIIDRNFLCVTDFTENIVALEPMEKRWSSFGWNVERINGHSIEALLDVLTRVRSRTTTQPSVIIADTIKGHGIAHLCYNPLYHGVTPIGEKADQALDEIERRCNYE